MHFTQGKPGAKQPGFPACKNTLFNLESYYDDSLPKIYKYFKIFYKFSAIIFRSQQAIS